MKTKKILLCWLGNNDLKAAGLLPKDQSDRSVGPIAEALQNMSFDQLHLLCNQKGEAIEGYQKWLGERNDIEILSKDISLSSPIHFGDIYSAVDSYLTVLLSVENQEVTIHLSPGTPAMTAVSILLGKTKYDTKFIQSSKSKGAEYVDIPFNISAEFIPLASKSQDKKLVKLSAGEAPVNAEFSDIITQNPSMLKTIEKASAIAKRDVPALILGDSGTGKELFAKAIHNGSQRSRGPLIIVNCGAIPKDLIDSELFGHAKGAFSGAVSNKIGYFEAADNGTIFLDEFGELPEDAQVRLLRVLQSGEFSRVGETTNQKVDVRVIAATNRDLSLEIAEGRFREDLFYRVAIGVIKLPALKDREGDLVLLAEHMMEEINKEAADQPGYIHKNISVKAKNIILNYAWPGNVRELYGSLLRASLWSDTDMITEEDMQDALLERTEVKSGMSLPEIGKGIDIIGVLDEVKQEYIHKALDQTGGNKKKAAGILGLSNYQTLTNWMDKLGLK